MSNLYQQVVVSQFEAALAMLKQCLERCPAPLWESKIAGLTVRQVAYHTLFFVDYYLDSEAAFTLRDLHHAGGDEREPVNSPGLDQASTVAYVTICHDKLLATIPNETEASLLEPAGFSWLPFTRASCICTTCGTCNITPGRSVHTCGDWMKVVGIAASCVGFAAVGGSFRQVIGGLRCVVTPLIAFELLQRFVHRRRELDILERPTCPRGQFPLRRAYIDPVRGCANR